MARLFVYSDNLAARVELAQDQVEGTWRAYCAGCTPAYDRYDSGPDLLRGSREAATLDDATAMAGDHADTCRRCVDPACLTRIRHDAGHRCRF